MDRLEIPLSRPDLSPLEEQLVLTALRSERLAMGPMTEEFERRIASLAGVAHAVAVSSGTAGLFCVLTALGLGPGDEVITTPFSFVASTNVILQVGAKPVFVDIEPVSLNIDPGLIERAITPRTRAILAVEAFGNPTHMDAYANIAARHGIPMIEDCCEALGTRHTGRPAGSFGRAGVFAFYPNKQITTGEGGVIVTDDDHLAGLCRSLRNQGRPIDPTGRQRWLSHERLGYNFRMSELQAAVGVGQMRRLATILERRNLVAKQYIDRLSAIPDLVLPTVDRDTEMSWFVFVPRLGVDYTREERDEIIDGFRAHDIGAADYFPCIHLLPFIRERLGTGPGQFPIAESISSRTIALPFHGQLTEREIELVAQTLELLLGRNTFSRR
ncbi:MAG: DegT/DnrJ/EryC1/StrS family aminotransferase [Phycisphaeraceae bacterium]|nr:MAG: DegT/DnrJ/EryC1/StrS family aminotransferase [Phycisphaeraceae bacterium]